MELSILYAIQKIHNKFLDKTMIIITRLGDAGVFWTIIGIALTSIKQYRKCGLTILLSLVISALIVNLILKNIAVRKRPCWVDKSVKMLIEVPKDYSFPSGHTSASFAAAVSIFVYDKRIGILALILASLISFSRLYLFVHYPTDVIFGVISGVGSAYLSYLIINNIFMIR